MTEGGALTVVEDVEAEVPGLGGTQVGSSREAWLEIDLEAISRQMAKEG